MNINGLVCVTLELLPRLTITFSQRQVGVHHHHRCRHAFHHEILHYKNTQNRRTGRVTMAHRVESPTTLSTCTAQPPIEAASSWWRRQRRRTSRTMTIVCTTVMTTGPFCRICYCGGNTRSGRSSSNDTMLQTLYGRTTRHGENPLVSC